jgi:hypothetical protein
MRRNMGKEGEELRGLAGVGDEEDGVVLRRLTTAARRLVPRSTHLAYLAQITM